MARTLRTIRSGIERILKERKSNFNFSSLVYDRIGTRFLYLSLYCLFPFLLVGILYTIMLLQEPPDGNFFSFFSDYTNSIAILYLLPIAFIFSGYYRSYSDNVIDKLGSVINNGTIKERLSRRYALRNVFEIIAFIASLYMTIFFVGTIVHPILDLKSSETILWIRTLSGYTQFYYGFVLFCTWYFSLLFGVDIITNCIVLSSVLIPMDVSDITLDEKHYDQAFGLKKLEDLIAVHLSMALYFLLGGILIVISDLVNKAAYGIPLTFAVNYVAQFAQYTLIVAVAIIAVLPIIGSRRLIHQKKRKTLRREIQRV